LLLLCLLRLLRRWLWWLLQGWRLTYRVLAWSSPTSPRWRWRLLVLRVLLHVWLLRWVRRRWLQ
jgi:hypothetical protein